MDNKNRDQGSFLDTISHRDVRLTPQRFRAIADYYWEHYCYFSNQRSLIINALKEALTQHAGSWTFTGWQRVVSYQYSSDPLSAKGSLLNNPGGRFNIGDIDQTKFPRFPALYLAENRSTAYKEKFGLYEPSKKHPGLTVEDLALTSHQSISIVCLKGDMTQVLSLNDTLMLKAFFNVIKNIKLPKNLVADARKLNINPMLPVKDVKELKNTLLDPSWRSMPMHFDVPSNSQIFGQIAHASGIEAILYPSKMSDKNHCLAIFPENLKNSTSFIEIEDVVPALVKNKRLDSETYLALMT